MSSLRLITAGESHGPGLTCIVEGLPAGLELDQDAINGDMARRQLGHGRGGRMKIETRPRRGHRRRPPRPHARRPDRAAGRQPRLRQLGGADEPVAGRGGRRPRCTCRAPATPTSSASWKYGFTRRAQRARARERARDRRARRRRRAGQGVPARARRRGPLARHRRSASVARRARERARARGLRRRRRRRPVRCLDAEASARDGRRRSTSCARRTSRSAASSRCVAFGLVPGLGSHVSWEERLDGRIARALMSIQAIKGVGVRRRLRPRRPCPARRPTTRSSTATSAASTARRTAPAASRAA